MRSIAWRTVSVPGHFQTPSPPRPDARRVEKPVVPDSGVRSGILGLEIQTPDRKRQGGLEDSGVSGFSGQRTITSCAFGRLISAVHGCTRSRSLSPTSPATTPESQKPQNLYGAHGKICLGLLMPNSRILGLVLPHTKRPPRRAVFVHVSRRRCRTRPSAVARTRARMHRAGSDERPQRLGCSRAPTLHL